MKDSRNLVESLGRSYINDWFQEAHFMHEGKLYYLYRVESNDFFYAVPYGEDGEPNHNNMTRLPTSLLTGFSFFKYPELGYRNLKVGDANLVVLLRSTRTARRGLSFSCLNMEIPSVFQLFPENRAYQLGIVNQFHLMKQAFDPTFISFAEGLPRLLNGDIVGFAINSKVAVMLDAEARTDPYYKIMFREERAGRISSDGEVIITNKTLSRSRLSEVFNRG